MLNVSNLTQWLFSSRVDNPFTQPGVLAGTVHAGGQADIVMRVNPLNGINKAAPGASVRELPIARSVSDGSAVPGPQINVGAAKPSARDLRATDALPVPATISSARAPVASAFPLSGQTSQPRLQRGASELAAYVEVEYGRRHYVGLIGQSKLCNLSEISAVEQDNYVPAYIQASNKTLYIRIEHLASILPASKLSTRSESGRDSPARTALAVAPSLRSVSDAASTRLIQIEVLDTHERYFVEERHLKPFQNANGMLIPVRRLDNASQLYIAEWDLPRDKTDDEGCDCCC